MVVTPLMALHIMAFVIGVIMYVLAGLDEGNETPTREEAARSRIIALFVMFFWEVALVIIILKIIIIIGTTTAKMFKQFWVDLAIVIQDLAKQDTTKEEGNND